MQPELIHFQELGDDRGSLIALEQHQNIPFEIKRVYYIFDTADNARRGFHAHKALKQVAICVKGACTFLLDNGKEKINYRLDSQTTGLYIGNNIWHEMFDFTEDCVLIVLANELYDEADYIRNHDEFLKVIANESCNCG